MNYFSKLQQSTALEPYNVNDPASRFPVPMAN